MKTALGRKVALWTILLGVGSQANAAVLEVGTSRTYSTIQAAVNAAGSGDTILVYPGVYNESVIVANHDANNDYDYSDPGDKDYSGLRIIGAGASPSDVVIRPHTSPFVVDGIRYNYVRVYDPEGVNAPSYSYKVALLFNGQKVGDGSPAANFVYNIAFPYYGFLRLAQQHTLYRNYVGQHDGESIEGIEVANLKFDYADVGLFANGYYENLVVRNCVFTNNNTGLRLEGGVSTSAVYDNTFVNNKDGIILRDECFDNDVYNNTVTINDNVATENPFYGEGWFSGINLHNSNNATGEWESTRNQVTRNTVDFRSYTGTRPSTGINFNGGRDQILDNNFVRGCNLAGGSDSQPWMTGNKGTLVEGWELQDNYMGLYFGVQSAFEISRMKFTDFKDVGIAPPASTDGPSGYHHFPCDPNVGSEQYLRRDFKVPSTGTTTISFSTWFSENGWQIVSLVDRNNPANVLPLFINHANFGATTGLPNQHFGLAGFGPARDPYGSSCSGSYVSTDPGLLAGNRTVNYASAPGMTRVGDKLNALASLPVEWAGRDVTLEFRHVPYFAPAFSCEIDGSTEWCGWYVNNFQINNSSTGVVNDVNAQPINETAGVVGANWNPSVKELSFAVYFANNNNAADYATQSQFYNGPIDINQNEFSNPWGDGIQFNSPLSTDPAKLTRITDNSFFDNAGFAVKNSQTSPIDAENNWWNSNNGPTIASNPGGDGDSIYDPAGSVDFTPWTRGLYASSVDTASFGAGTLNGCGTNFSVSFLDGERNVVLGTLGCNGTFTAGATTPGGPLLLRITGTPPAWPEGSFLNVTVSGTAYRAYLPPNRGGRYTGGLYLWLDTQGSTFFACGPTGTRNCTYQATNWQNPTVARNTSDFAQRKGFLTFPLITTAGSDFNWFGQTHFTSDVANARQLYNYINAQYGGTLVRTLAVWNAASQSFTQYIRVPFESGNFNLALGRAYRAEVNANHNFELSGAEPQLNSLTYNLLKTQSTGFNWISIPWYKTDLVFASDLADDISATNPGALDAINTWNATAQAFVQYINDPILGLATDFDVSRGQAVRLDVNRAATWAAVAD